MNSMGIRQGPAPAGGTPSFLIPWAKQPNKRFKEICFQLRPFDRMCGRSSLSAERH